MKILVLDGGNQNTLAIVRYLGLRKDLELHVVGYNSLSQACYSKFVSRKFIFPSVKADESGFRTALLNRLRAEKYDLLMPVGFHSFSVCMKNKQQIEELTKVILTTDESFKLAESKLKTYRFAQQNGIDCPKTYFLQDRSDIKSLEAPYPLVVKAPFEMGKNIVEYANNKEELVTKFNKMCDDHGFSAPDLPVVQQYITGEGYGFFAYCENGKCVQTFMHHRLREYPVTGGASVCAESFHDAELFNAGKKMVELTGWNGVVMVEFKKHSDGKYKLMEINPKFWGSLELALAAGINFPMCLVKRVANEVVEQKNEFKPIKFQWLLNGELFHFFERPSSFSGSSRICGAAKRISVYQTPCLIPYSLF